MDHNEEHIHRVLGISDERRTHIRERIFFSCMRQVLQTAELFENADDAPPSLNTLTSYLKTCLQQMDDELDYEYALLNFFTMGKMAIGSARRYVEQSNDEISAEEKVKQGIGTLIQKMIRLREQEEDEDEDEPMIDRLNEETMLKRVRFVKQNINNFEAYFKTLKRWSNNASKDDFDVDDLLHDILKK